MSEQVQRRPLEGVVVLDLTQFLADPYASEILGDPSARVIRMEPLHPELSRTLPPHFHKGDSAYFLSINRNKESIAVDLRTQAGKDILRQFAAKADMLIENFRPGVADRLAALLKARETGQGSYIDIAMLDCQVAMLSYQAAYHLMSGNVPGPQGRSHDSIPTCRGFTCRDDVEIVVAANTEAMWRNLCVALQRPELSDNARFDTNHNRYTNRVELDAILEAAFRSFASHDIMVALIENNVPARVINSLNDVMTDDQVPHRDMVPTLYDSAGDAVRVVGNPVKIRDTDTPLRFPPALGENSPALLVEFAGRTDDDIARLERDSIILNTVRP